MKKNPFFFMCDFIKHPADEGSQQSRHRDRETQRGGAGQAGGGVNVLVISFFMVGSDIFSSHMW